MKIATITINKYNKSIQKDVFDNPSKVEKIRCIFLKCSKPIHIMETTKNLRQNVAWIYIPMEAMPSYVS